MDNAPAMDAMPSRLLLKPTICIATIKQPKPASNMLAAITLRRLMPFQKFQAR